MLDNIGGRIDLNGSEEVTTVRENIALLVAEGQPELPIKGLRIATRDTDVFTDGAFEIIRGIFLSYFDIIFIRKWK